MGDGYEFSEGYARLRALTRWPNLAELVCGVIAQCSRPGLDGAQRSAAFTPHDKVFFVREIATFLGTCNLSDIDRAQFERIRHSYLALPTKDGQWLPEVFMLRNVARLERQLYELKSSYPAEERAFRAWLAQLFLVPLGLDPTCDQAEQFEFAFGCVWLALDPKEIARKLVA